MRQTRFRPCPLPEANIQMARARGLKSQPLPSFCQPFFAYNPSLAFPPFSLRISASQTSDSSPHAPIDNLLRTSTTEEPQFVQLRPPAATTPRLAIMMRRLRMMPPKRTWRAELRRRRLIHDLSSPFHPPTSPLRRRRFPALCSSVLRPQRSSKACIGGVWALNFGFSGL